MNPRADALVEASVLVPYRAFGTERDEAWRVVRAAWEETSVELLVESPGPGASPAEFNHPAAINAAARRATRRVLIVADADCLWTPASLPSDLVWALRFGASWALAREYAKLGKQQTRRRLTGRDAPHAEVMSKPEWVGTTSWAGLVAITAEAFARIGGYDERFAWWGADDAAFGLKADTLLGPHARVPGSVLHLHHAQPLDHTYGHERHKQQYALGERYKGAAGIPAAMRRLAGLEA